MNEKISPDLKREFFSSNLRNEGFTESEIQKILLAYDDAHNRKQEVDTGERSIVNMQVGDSVYINSLRLRKDAAGNYYLKRDTKGSAKGYSTENMLLKKTEDGDIIFFPRTDQMQEDVKKAQLIEGDSDDYIQVFNAFESRNTEKPTKRPGFFSRWMTGG